MVWKRARLMELCTLQQKKHFKEFNVLGTHISVLCVHIIYAPSFWACILKDEENKTKTKREQSDQKEGRKQ